MHRKIHTETAATSWEPILVWGCFLLTLFIIPACKPQPQPNIIFVLVDDMGRQDLGFTGNRYDTPHIDQLAQEGMFFTQAYAAAAVCSPTRASILTGRYPARIGVTDWIRGRQSGVLYPEDGQTPGGYETQRDWQLQTPRNPLWMEREEVTLGELLQAAGYVTGHIGKWHLGPEGWYPEDQGFDENHGGLDFGQPPTYFDPYVNGMLSISNLPPREEGEYLTDREADEAVAFIRRHQDEPFFLNLWHYAVHGPLMAKEESTAAYRDSLKEHYPLEPVYAAMVKSVDDAMGKVMEAVEEAGIADRTLIVFFSDNGGSTYYHDQANAPFRLGKGYPYEGGIREPLIVHWPGVTNPGSRCETPVSSVDFFPTLLQAAGVEVPETLEIDGVDLGPLLTQQSDLQRDALFWHFPHYWGDKQVRPFSVVRKGDWKLIRFYEKGRHELYNLRKDPQEARDLAAEMPEKVAELGALLDSWLKETDAKIPLPNPDYDPEMDKEILAYKVTHLALGVPVTFLRQPNSKYGKGPTGLTDGWKGSGRFSDGHWLGWEGEEMEAILDLGKLGDVQRVEIGFLHNPSSWIFAPREVIFSVSEEGNTFREIGRKENEVPLDEPAVFVKNFALTWDKTPVRYLKVETRSLLTCPPGHAGAGDKAWLMVDEVVVD